MSINSLDLQITQIFMYFISFWWDKTVKLSGSDIKYLQFRSESESCSVVSASLWPHGLYIYSSWNSPGQNTGVGSLSLLQGIFPTQGLNPGLPHCRWILYQLSHKASNLGSIPGSERCPGEGNGYSLGIVAWRISWTEEPSGIQSTRSQRVGHDWATNSFTYLILIGARGTGVVF